MITTNLLTYAEAGARLAVSAKVVANLTRSGELPRVVLSPRKHRIAPEDLDTYIARHRRTA
ncbi:helix-turn-helix domain-containing protein [Rhodococcus jostii]|uniref:helix-turn-helix domain-containing protein n=1 Tax=Rhodococcus jostii TaxID=132919 RepID=UPI00362FD182